MDIILASGSPRRKQLLEQINLKFKVITSDVDETLLTPLPPAEMVEYLSQMKAEAVAPQAKSGDIIIASDTVVALETAILGKPADDAEAFQMLSTLSGIRHQVYTGVTLLRDGERVTFHEVTSVTFRTLTEGEISAYIATGEPSDKAGSYGIQGFGALLVEKIEGDYFNVMGLPVCRLGQALKAWGVDVLSRA